MSIRRVLFALHTSSTNVMLGANSWAIRAARAKRERAVVEMILSDVRVGGRPPFAVVAAGMDVTLTRVSAGRLDDDNLRGAFKHVRDAVAAWLGFDDRDPCIRWHYLQQRCNQGWAGVRIGLEDSAPGPDLDIVLGPGPERLGPESESGAGELPKRRAERTRIAGAPPRAPAQQLPIPYRNTWALKPWDQDGSGLPELSELAIAVDADVPPARVMLPVPPLVRHMHAHARSAILRLAARTVRLERHAVHHPELGGAAYVYAELGAPELDFFRSEERTGT